MAFVFARDRNRFEVRLASRTGAVRGKGPIALEKALDAGGVSGPCVGRGSGHASTLVRGGSRVKGGLSRGHQRSITTSEITHEPSTRTRE